jgi:hypothetical protein
MLLLDTTNIYEAKSFVANAVLGLDNFIETYNSVGEDSSIANLVKDIKETIERKLIVLQDNINFFGKNVEVKSDFMRSDVQIEQIKKARYVLDAVKSVLAAMSSTK